ncbi:MAG: hypothetical protein AMXMBFR36_09540 [Acidobacteriota bacterium]
MSVAAPSPSRTVERPGWLVATVLALVVMIAWTLVIKYLSPLVWFWSERLAGRDPGAAPVMWDFWPVAHAVLAAALWRRVAWARAFGLAVAAVEVMVVVAKLALYLRAPALDYWHLLWLTNKVYVLAVFSCLLYVLAGPGRRALAAAG